jgi:hypothetical protein
LLVELLNSDQGRAYFRRHAKSTSGLHTINSTVLKSFPVFQLKRDAEEKLTLQLSRLDDSLAMMKTAAELTVDLRQRLLPDLAASTDVH